MTFISLSIMLTLRYHPSVRCTTGTQSSDFTRNNSREPKYATFGQCQYNTHANCVYSFSSQMLIEMDDMS